MSIALLWVAASSTYKAIRKTLLSFANNLSGIFTLWAAGVLIAGLLFMLFEEGRGFWTSVYWSGITGLSIGYGDISPATEHGRALAVVWGAVSIMILVPMIIGVFIQRVISNMHLFSDIEQRLLMALARFIGKFLWIILGNQVAMARKVDLLTSMLATAPGADQAKSAEILAIKLNDGNELKPAWDDILELDEDEQEETLAEAC